MTQSATPDATGESARIDALLDELLETRRQIAALHAREARLMVRAFDLVRAQSVRGTASSSPDIPLRSMAAQIAAATRVSDRTVHQRLDASVMLVERFPRRLPPWPAATSTAHTCR
jgi:hypothetical protein